MQAALYLSQLEEGGVICRRGDDARRVLNATSTYALAQEAIDARAFGEHREIDRPQRTHDGEARELCQYPAADQHDHG